MTGSTEFPADLFVETVDRETGRVKLVPVPVKFVEWLLEESWYLVPVDVLGTGGRGLEMYIYDGSGLYRSGAVGYVHRRVEDAFRARGTTAKHRFAEEVSLAIARRSSVPRSLINPPGRLNVRNGVLDVASGELLPHASKHYYTWRLPTDFDASAGCPGFKKFLAEVLPKESDRREIQKLFGYALTAGNRYQCSHVLVGQGCNGKSTLLRVLIGLLGKDNVCGETLQSLCDNRFSPLKLYGKLANIFADLPTNPLKYTGIFKALTGEDMVRAEAKFGAITYFFNGAKLIFSANTLPEVDDRTRAFWRRWFLIRFEENFTDREDRALLGKLLAELPGILNWAIAGIPLLVADNGFSSSAGDLKEEWVRRSDSLGWFIAEMVQVDPLERIPKQDFYEIYAEFCGRNKLPPKPPARVGEEIARHVPSVRTEQPRLTPGAPPTRCWRGIRIRSEVQLPVSPASPVSGSGQTTLPGVVEAGDTGETGTPSPVQLRVESCPEEPGGADAADAADASPPTQGGDAPTPAGLPPEPPRTVHPNCLLCSGPTAIEHHVCYACPACNWYEAHGDERGGA